MSTADRRTALLALADRVETEPASRELEALVWLHAGPDQTEEDLAVAWREWAPLSPSSIVNGRTMAEAVEKFPHDLAGIARAWNVPRLLHSLDAAASLVPEGRHWRVAPGCAEVEDPASGVRSGGHYVAGTSRPFMGRAPGRPAAALTAAALRALAEEASHG